MNYFKTKICDHCDQIIIQIGSRWFAQHNEKNNIAQISLNSETLLSQTKDGQRADKLEPIAAPTKRRRVSSDDEMSSKSPSPVSAELAMRNSNGGNLRKSRLPSNNGDINAQAEQPSYECSICNVILLNLLAAYQHVRNAHHFLTGYKKFIGINPQIERSKTAKVVIHSRLKGTICASNTNSAVICNNNVSSGVVLDGQESKIKDNRKQIKCFSKNGTAYGCSLCPTVVPNLLAAYQHVQAIHKYSTGYKKYIQVFKQSGQLREMNMVTAKVSGDLDPAASSEDDDSSSEWTHGYDALDASSDEDNAASGDKMSGAKHHTPIVSGTVASELKKEKGKSEQAASIEAGNAELGRQSYRRCFRTENTTSNKMCDQTEKRSSGTVIEQDAEKGLDNTEVGMTLMKKSSKPKNKRSTRASSAAVRRENRSESNKQGEHESAPAKVNIKRKYLICGICDSRMETAQEIKTHLKNDHRPEETAKERKSIFRYRQSILKCSACSNEAKSRMDNLLHYYNVHEQNKNVFKEIKWKDIFKRNGKGYACKECGKFFKAGEDYCQHLMRTHPSDIENLEALKLELIQFCSECKSPYLFNRTEARVGSCCARKRGNIVCDVCGISFRYRERFNEHMNRHNGEKPYQCDICAKAFPSSNDLRNHHFTHKDLHDKFRCTFEGCDHNFSDNTGLKRHLFVAHNAFKTKIDCPICGKPFPYKKYLENHIKKTH